MKNFILLFKVSAFAAAVLFIVMGVKAQDVVNVEKESSFVKADGSFDKDLEPSAVQAINEKYFLVADDKTPDLLVVESSTGKIVNRFPIPEFSEKKPKWEAMAYDGEFFYIVGSHNVKIEGDPAKLPGKLAARSHLFRFKLTGIAGNIADIKIESALELDIKDSLKNLGLYNADPNINKVKIEGLAVRTNSEKKKELFFALREPHDLMLVYSGEIPAAPVSKEKLTLKPHFNFEAGKISIVPFRLSSLEYVPHLDGFLTITSTEDGKNLFYGNALWFITNSSVKDAGPSKPLLPHLVWLFDVKMKAEGLTVLPSSTGEKVRLAIVYDNDAEDTQKVGMIRLLELIPKAK